jgi:hypothetical protein
VPRRTAATGRFRIPDDWPKWHVKCPVVRKGKPCKAWAVTGMPTCRMHGSGGERNRQLGLIRYMCWIILGGPKNIPVNLAATTALGVFCEAVMNNSDANPNQQMKAALWLTQALQSTVVTPTVPTPSE